MSLASRRPEDIFQNVDAVKIASSFEELFDLYPCVVDILTNADGYDDRPVRLKTKHHIDTKEDGLFKSKTA